MKVLAFGALGHGLLTNRALEGGGNAGFGVLAPQNLERNLPLVQTLKRLADEKGVGVSDLAIAWVLAKHPHVQTLVGTTSPEHLRQAIGAARISLTDSDVAAIERAIPEGAVAGIDMRAFVFENGKMSRR